MHFVDLWSHEAGSDGHLWPLLRISGQHTFCDGSTMRAGLQENSFFMIAEKVPEGVRQDLDNYVAEVCTPLELLSELNVQQF